MSTPSFFYELSGAGVASVFTAVAGKALPQGRDLALDLDNDDHNDLLIVGGDLVLVADKAAIKQEISIRLKFLRGSWFLDTTAGLPYFEDILVKSPNIAAVRTLFTNEILASAGVKGILSLTFDFNRQTRTLAVAYSVNTDVGQLDDNLVL